MIELTKEEASIVAQILMQVSVPIKDSPTILEIIKKLQIEPMKEIAVSPSQE